MLTCYFYTHWCLGDYHTVALHLLHQSHVTQGAMVTWFRFLKRLSHCGSAQLLLFFPHPLNTNSLSPVWSAVTCGSLSTRCRAALPGWWRPSREPFGCSHSTVHFLAGSVLSGADFLPLPELPYPPSPPSLWARWQSRCCWWRARLSGPNAAETCDQVCVGFKLTLCPD